MLKSCFRISELIYRQKLEKITLQEKDELERWIQESDFHKLLYLRLTGKREWEKEYLSYQQISAEQAWKNIVRVLRRKKRFRFYRWVGKAAIVIVSFGAIAIGVLHLNPSEEFLQTDVCFSDSICPGYPQAVLQLADGQKIVLKNSDLQLKTDVALIHQHANHLTYKADSSLVAEKINTLTVPWGGEFHVILSDGTRVWLNAGSRLEYPEAFVGGCRRVRLVGEAYFEVEKDEHKPFIVRLQKAEIKVLGTNFNVKDFAEERRTVTTLMEGRAELSVCGRKMVIRPNQQVCYFPDEDRLDVKKVEAVDFMAWKEGKFVFRDEPLEYIMETIARWYNVQVFYLNPNVKSIPFSGKMNRYENVDKILEMIEQTGKVHFELNHREVTVMSK